jgi:hypothetical protein
MSEQLMETQDQYLQYRALSVSAVSTLLLAIISLPALVFAKLLVFPLLGLGVGVYSLLKLRHRRHEFVGYNLACIGTLICVVVLVVGGTYSAYVYATEVPEGYQRISFYELQPDKNDASALPIPPTAIALDGKQVFVAGYVHPGVDRRKGLKQFVLVPDMKTCCFGGQPKLTDMIEVTLKDPNRIDYSFARRKLAGTLRVSPYKKPVSGLDGVYYQLEADYVR